MKEKEKMLGEMSEKMLKTSEEMPEESEESDDSEKNVNHNEQSNKEKEKFSKAIEAQKKEKFSKLIKIPKENIKNSLDTKKDIKNISINSRFQIKKNVNEYLLTPDKNGEYCFIGEEKNSYIFIDNCKDVFKAENGEFSKESYDDIEIPENVEVVKDDEKNNEIEIPENTRVVNNNCFSNLCRKISICCTNCLANLKNCLCCKSN